MGIHEVLEHMLPLLKHKVIHIWLFFSHSDVSGINLGWKATGSRGETRDNCVPVCANKI